MLYKFLHITINSVTSVTIIVALQFDSGGPVLWQNPTTKRLVLVGIINYGFGCGSDKPGVNARVTSYLDWITYVTPGKYYIPT